MAIFSRTSTQSPMHTSESPASVASSWADTDCESDSDNECASYAFFGNKHTRKTARALKHIQLRTAPISIPQATHTVRSSKIPLNFEESPPQQHGGEAYDRNSMDGLEIDEDLMLFGNLAYLRTQHGDMSGFCQRSTAESAPSDEDEQIFELEI